MNALHADSLIVVTGAAGLVGQNLVTELVQRGHRNIAAIDKHAANLHTLQTLHPTVKTILADMAEPGTWADSLAGAERLFLLQAQITGAQFDIFQRNTLDSTARVLDAAKLHKVPFTVFVGSSVVNSVSDDNYTRSKKAQEALMAASGLSHCVARPTLMYGWFDPKHLGWLSRFMAQTPVFPIPGHGRYMRQPLYVRDFCRVLLWCAEQAPAGQCFDIVGQEDVTYIDIIRAIKGVKELPVLVLPLPVPLFRFMMQVYGWFFANPPFVADQLDALMAGDYFKGDDFAHFGMVPTPFRDAIRETFTDPTYSQVVLER